MINMGQIHMELGKFLMITLNLIKLYDELIIEIRENGNFMKENFKTILQSKKSSNLTLISWRNLRSKRGVFSENWKNEIKENNDEIKLNY